MASQGPTHAAVLLMIRSMPPPRWLGPVFQKPSLWLLANAICSSGERGRIRDAGTSIPARQHEQNLFLKWTLPHWKPGWHVVASPPFSSAPQQRFNGVSGGRGGAMRRPCCWGGG